MKTNSLYKLGCTIEDLYNNKIQVNIHFENSEHIFHLVLKSFEEVDCKLSSYSANIWMRTKAGTEKRKYKRLKYLQTEIKKLIKRNIDISGIIYFSLSNKINQI
tara:strand:- start:201 stop:512 length:312 start_codon:yes stop_codon:yes gene_type:complete